tara:strand:- start:1532 stop:2002 length:471 start_codon:yes stop_codon:yes gene_type:complete
VQQIYEAEGLPLDRIEVVDNQPTLELLEGRPVSLLGILDDLCLHAGAVCRILLGLKHLGQQQILRPTLSLTRSRPMSEQTDKQFVGALHARFSAGETNGRDAPHPSFPAPRFDAADTFTVRHFAGDVTYHGASFLLKNKDALFAVCRTLWSSIPQL